MSLLSHFSVLASKAYWVDVAKRAGVTFGVSFATQLSAAAAGIVSLSTAKAVVLSSLAFAGNVVYRAVIKPELSKDLITVTDVVNSVSSPAAVTAATPVPVAPPAAPAAS